MFPGCWSEMILLVEEILHGLIGTVSWYLRGFLHSRQRGISSINSSDPVWNCGNFFTGTAFSPRLELPRCFSQEPFASCHSSFAAQSLFGIVHTEHPDLAPSQLHASRACPACSCLKKGPLRNIPLRTGGTKEHQCSSEGSHCQVLQCPGDRLF